MTQPSSDLLEALRDLARGRVHRSRHSLIVDGKDLTGLFESVLAQEGYRSLRVREVDVPRGVRLPAFFLADGIAHFGHVFQEKFREEEARILFGSVVRNWRGDWEVILTRRNKESVWVKTDAPVPFDEDRPSGGL
jgi:hypothetical protein